ncbi:Isochorismatase domain-containing protein, partial [Lachnellula occidentalis]
ICDIQEKFRPVIWEYASIISTTQKLLRFATILSIPIFVTTQNAARLGPTCPELNLQHASGALNGKESEAGNGSGGEIKVVEHVDKTAFSMWIPSISRHFEGGEKAEIVIVGIESHICVTQTALDALRAGHRVYVIADGVSSCNREEIPVALARLRAEGAVVTSSEKKRGEEWLGMAQEDTTHKGGKANLYVLGIGFMYECMGDAAIGEFKEVARLVKETQGVTKESVVTLLSKI